MPVQIVLSTVFTAGVEQFLQWRYGPMGFVGLVLLTIGVKARNVTCGSLGVVVLTLLITGPSF
ncbi:MULTISPECIES: hypothetical protein [Streptomyces]|jgi:hypothetical protein|uniref:Uncharacterized protein n=3 Tax=Streptomyces griseoaurantiacus TaxID=68213 RepID=F3NEE9_9ACTN|nr:MULTISPECIES: hypothetical protein [Streptomyces]EGG48218.1 hypothetical protein SGM_1513 [Streptomyces griseoaurantiacus M045]MBA5225959.1 hypothetical protein [Streptomyces griseoaurantiacus]MCF0085636.1 hypothetical protein [Streptomyces sp. MH192]MCF0098233.1 hypothetical protein [Streptomyces sp. MH191]MDX3087567.1 hypothetical protein [Streptomyces sp. ME12-02E]